MCKIATTLIEVKSSNINSMLALFDTDIKFCFLYRNIPTENT